MHDDTRPTMPGRAAILEMEARIMPPEPTPEETEAARETFLRSWSSRRITARLAAPESPMQGFELLGGAS